VFNLQILHVFWSRFLEPPERDRFFVARPIVERPLLMMGAEWVVWAGSHGRTTEKGPPITSGPNSFGGCW
jgi:hypothetical protein